MFERADRIGGLLRYGIPDFKMEKRVLDRRLAMLVEEGIGFRSERAYRRRCPGRELRRDFDAIVLAGGAAPRDLPVPGPRAERHSLRDGLPAQQNRRCDGDERRRDEFISAAGKRVVIIGGGDTGADCLGTVHRQGARSVHQFELLPGPECARGDNPWPQWPQVFRVSSAHEEGGERVFRSRPMVHWRRTGTCCAPARRQADAGPVGRARRSASLARTRCSSADLVLLAMGFTARARALDPLGARSRIVARSGATRTG